MRLAHARSVSRSAGQATDNERRRMIGWDAIVGEKWVMAILRGQSPERAVAIAEELWTGGIELIEVTIGDPRDSAVLRAVTAAAAAHGRPVGAGTVTTVERVRAAT